MNEKSVDIDEIIERYPGQPEYLIFLLQDLQAEYGFVSEEAMGLVCDHCNVPLSTAYSTATFYKSFSLKPQGEHKVHVCQGTACHLKGSERIVEDLERKLQINAGETTEDLAFSLETVNCLGCCALSPAVVVDGEYHANTTPTKIGKVIDKLRS